MYDPRHQLRSLKFSKTAKATVRNNWPDRRLPPQTSNCCYVKHKCHLLIINLISDLFKVKIIYQMFRHIFQTGACRKYRIRTQVVHWVCHWILFLLHRCCLSQCCLCLVSNVACVLFPMLPVSCSQCCPCLVPNVACVLFPMLLCLAPNVACVLFPMFPVSCSKCSLCLWIFYTCLSIWVCLTFIK